MNSTLVIARRELAEKRFIFITALAFLALALIIPFMPGVHDGERAGALVIGSLTLATALSVGLAAILGGSIVGRELSDGRLSFYFSKPLPATSIWWGKLLAAAALILASFVIVGFPALVAGGAAALRGWTPEGTWSIVGFILLAAAALFLLSHVIGTFVRSRSAWFLFDFIAAVICGTAMWVLIRALLAGFALTLTLRLLQAFAILAALAIVAAGAWQLERGRTDRKRSHMELSRFLWISIGCGVLVVAAFVAWVVSVRPGQLITLYDVKQTRGDWAFISGRARDRLDYRAAFFYNVSTGRSVRIGNGGAWAEISDDGSVACWLVGVRRSDLWIARLNGSAPQLVRTRLTFDRPVRLFLSANGGRLAVLEEGKTLSVYDVSDLRMLASVRLPSVDWWNFGSFADAGHFRMLALRPPAVAVEFDVPRKALVSIPAKSMMPRMTPRLTIQSTRLAVEVTRDGSAVFDRDRGTMIRKAIGIYPLAHGVTGPNVICMSPRGLIIWNAVTGETRPL